jgi:hypothetical protein
MTIRERFNRRRRRLITIAVLGAAGSWVGFAFAKQEPMIGILAFLSFLAGFIAIVYGYQFAFRCPACGAGLGNIVMQNPSPLRFCPYCGLDIDAEEVEKPEEDAG